MAETYQGRSIARDIAEGEALVTRQPLSFFGGVDPANGTIVQKGHELSGTSVSGKVLVLPPLKGSTASTWTLCQLAENRRAPVAIIVPKADIILIAGAIIGKVPTVDNLDFDPTVKFKTGQKLRVNGNKGTVTLLT